MDEFTVVSSPIQPHLLKLIKTCQSTLTIVSPYIKRSAIEWLIAEKPDAVERLSVLTNISLPNILSKSLEIAALRLTLDSFRLISIFSLPSLHAKVFIFDQASAFITSANFTNGGLWTNYEYGIIVKDRNTIEQIAQDVNSYMELGGEVSRSLLDAIEGKANELAVIEKQIETSKSTKALHKEIRQRQTEIQNALLSNRLRKGQTINNLFSDTILLALRKYRDGLTTPQLHAEVQGIHPDICDDSIDRVIKGQHFGKRWKHYVRRAQEFLKDKGAIVRQENVWRLNGTPER